MFLKADFSVYFPSAYAGRRSLIRLRFAPAAEDYLRERQRFSKKTLPPSVLHHVDGPTYRMSNNAASPFPSAKLCKHLRVSIHDDGAAVLDVNGGRVFTANKVGSRVLALLEQGLSLEHIVEHISSEFGEPLNRVQADVGKFMETLRSRKLLEE
jgi:hypothetical protein